VIWDPKSAPAAVSLMAPLPVPEMASRPLPGRSSVTRQGPGDLLFLRLATGEGIALCVHDRDRPLGILLPLDDHWAARLAAARRLRARLLGRRAPRDPLSLQQRRRIAMALRALDAREAQTVLRTIAEHLYGAERVRDEPWKTSPLKAQVARLIAHGRHLTEHGYRALLLGQRPTGRGKRDD
jgi:hypothetical protein